MQALQISSAGRDSPRPARREESVAGEAERAGATEAGRLDGGVPLILGLTTAGEPGPRSIRLSSVASLKTCITITTHQQAGQQTHISHGNGA